MVIPYNSVPLVYENIVVVGANTPRGAIGGIGNARAFDARTGAKVWEFSSVPRPGSIGHDTWEGDSWQGRLGANAWPFYFTMDEQRGHLYLPLASPIPFAYGGDRAGANLFANSLVAVDIRTGEYVWHFQTIHHDLWDHDPPAAPVLFDVHARRHGPSARRDHQVRLPVHPRSRNRGTDLRGGGAGSAAERSSWRANLSHPADSREPAALARVSYEPADLVAAEDTSPEHAAACADLVESLGEIYNDGAFTPWVYRAEGASDRTTLLFPGLVGGHNWGGGGIRSELRVRLRILTGSRLARLDGGRPGRLAPALPEGGSTPVELRCPDRDARLPCQKPPWGRLTAVDASTGDVVWQQSIGITEQLPADRQNTGRPGRAAAIVTGGGVLFVASTDDNRLRALEARRAGSSG